MLGPKVFVNYDYSSKVRYVVISVKAFVPHVLHAFKCYALGTDRNVYTPD